MIPVIILTKNEAANIAECLNSVAWADERIVYDSGSSDDTVAIARECGATVFIDTDWQGFGVQRQRAQKTAQGEWIFMLDADERVSEDLRDEILAFLRERRNSTEIVGKFTRKNVAFGKRIRFGGWQSDCVLRLFHREHTHFSAAEIHESLEIPSGTEIRKFRGALFHEPYKTLSQYFEKLAAYTTAWAKSRSPKSAPQECSCFFRGAFMFFKKYFLRLGMLDGSAGLKLAWLSSIYTTLKYLKLAERRRAESSKAQSSRE